MYPFGKRKTKHTLLEIVKRMANSNAELAELVVKLEARITDLERQEQHNVKKP